MGGPDEIRSPPPPPPRVTGTDIVPRPPLATGDAALAPVVGAPPPDRYEWRTLGTSYLHGGGDFLSGLGAMLSAGDRIQTLESEILELTQRSRTATGTVLGQTMDRLTRDREVLANLHTLDGISVRRSDIDAMRQTAVDRLLAGAANPPRETEYQEGLTMLRSLQRYQALEARRDQFLTQVEGLYLQPRDAQILYQLDYSGLNAASLDPWTHPTLEALNNQRVIQVYRTLSTSSDPNDQRIAAAVRDLFGHMRAHDGVFANDGAGTATLETLQAATRDLEALSANADVQTFFQRIAEADRAAAGATPAGQARLDMPDSLAMLQAYPALQPILDQYDVRIGATRTPADQRTMLLDTVRTLIRRGDPYMRFLQAQPPGAEADALLATVRTDLAGLRDLETSLTAMSGESLTRPSLSAVALQMATITRDFQPVEERMMRANLTLLTDQIAQLPSSENNIQPIRDALAAITATEPATPADRVAAFRRVAQMIDSAAAIRLVDAHITMCDRQRSTVESENSFSWYMQWGGSGIADDTGEHVMEMHREREAQQQFEANYGTIRARYTEIRTLLTSSNPADVARGRQQLQQLEGSAMQGTLTQSATSAQQMLGFQILAISTIFAVAGGLIVAGGAMAGLGAAGVTLSVTGEALVFKAGMVVGGALAFTVANRNLNEWAMGPEANTHGFFTELGINLAIFATGEAIMFGVGKLITGCVERIAIANLARSGEIVLAEGGAATAQLSSFAVGTAQRAAVEQEMARVLQTLGGRVGTAAAGLGAEYAMFNALMLAQTAAELAGRNVPNPMARAADEVFSLRGQARIGMYIAAFRTLSFAMEPMAGPLRESLQNTLGERVFNARTAEMQRVEAQFLLDAREGRLADPSVFLRRSRQLLEGRQRLLIEAHAREAGPSQEISQEFAKGEMALRALDQMDAFHAGVVRISGEGNAFGIRSHGGDGSVFTYRPGQAQRIVDALGALPMGVDRANIRIHPNGMIEVPLLAVPYVNEARTIFLMPSTAVPRHPTGSALAVRPATAAL